MIQLVHFLGLFFLIQIEASRDIDIKLAFMNERVYPTKVVLAWAEAIGGNKDLREWLISNDFPELGLFVFALNNKQDARDWLMQNGYPHLMALINGAEGNVSAQLWLRKYGFDILEQVAKAADNDDVALEWLLERDYKDMAMIAQRMRFIKNEIERDNNDLHKISSD
jgi:hypothetical protein